MAEIIALPTVARIHCVQPRRCSRSLASVTRLVDVVARKAMARAEFRAFAASCGCPSRLDDKTLDGLLGFLDEFVADERRLKAQRALGA